MKPVFDVFKFYDELFAIYDQTVKPHKDEREVTVYEIARNIPSELTDEFEALVDGWLTGKGYDPEDL